jgi:hypothetical protein
MLYLHLPSNKYIWKKTGKYLDTIPNSLACDSIITINLNIINNTTYSFIASTVCDKYISPSHRYIWTSSGTYFDTLINSTGCDSIITIQLKVNKKSAASISPQVCRSYTSPSGKYIWMKSGKYTDIIPSANGCDSTITINLQVKTSIPLNISSVIAILIPPQAEDISGRLRELLRILCLTQQDVTVFLR